MQEVSAHRPYNQVTRDVGPGACFDFAKIFASAVKADGRTEKSVWVLKNRKWKYNAIRLVLAYSGEEILQRISSQIELRMLARTPPLSSASATRVSQQREPVVVNACFNLAHIPKTASHLLEDRPVWDGWIASFPLSLRLFLLSPFPLLYYLLRGSAYGDEHTVKVCQHPAKASHRQPPGALHRQPAVIRYPIEL
jgi:hypothetical protein